LQPQINIPTIPKDNAFNAVRLLLCLTVILTHTLEKVGITYQFLSGYVAVSGFFIISGFWVTKSYFCSANLKIFFTKRIKKILPMYYISVVSFSLVCFCISGLPASEYFGTEYFKYLLWNGVFLNFMQPSLPGCFDGTAVNGALWTIKIELGFYIMLPLILWLWGKTRSISGKNALLIVLYLISMAYNIIINKYIGQSELPRQLGRQLPSFIPHFVTGMFIYLNWGIFIKIKNWLIFPCVAIFVLFYFTNMQAVFPAAFAVTIVWAALYFKKLNFIGRGIDLSYGMYLFHYPLMQIIIHLTGGEVNIPLYISSIIATSAAMAFITEKYVQKKIKP